MKITIFLSILVIVSLICITSCKTKQKVLNQQEIESLPKVLAFSKSGCRGKCPVFDLTVYQNGWMVFNGRAWTKQEGIATDQLSKEAFVQLIKDCQEANLWNFETEYGMNVMDIPTTTLHFYEKNKDRKIRWRIGVPEQLPALSNKVMGIIYDRDWLEPIKKETGIRMPPGAIHNEIIVQFNEKINAKEWCLQYERYGMILKKPLSTLTPIFLVKFDTGKMSPDKMLRIVKSNEKVVSAEFNKRLETRNR